MKTNLYLSESDRPTALAATHAIILYAGSGRTTGLHSQHSLAALHPVDAGDGTRPPVIGPGTGLSRATMELMLRQVLNQETGGKERAPRAILSDVLYMGDGTAVDRMVWHAPARRRPIFFRTGKRDFDALFREATVLWCPLLFVAEPNSLRVFALASGDRPTADTPVYYAPFFNLSSNGAMCAGDVSLPGTLRPSERQSRWEAAFYESAFTHSNYGATRFVNHPRGHDGLWRNMVHRQDGRGFPARCLVPAAGRVNVPGAVVLGEPLTVGKVIE